MPRENTGKEVPFEWSQSRISSTNSKVIATKLASIIHSVWKQKGQEKIIHLVSNLSVIYNDHGAN